MKKRRSDNEHEMGDWVTMEADGSFSALLGKQTGSAYWSRRARVTSQATPFGTVILVWFLQGAYMYNLYAVKSADLKGTA